MASDFASWSPYNYVFGNPIRYIDPDGRSADDIVIRGENNSSVTIQTDLVDIEVDASSVVGDLGGNYELGGDDIIEAGLDIAGIFDPTGIVDAIAAKNSFDKGDYFSAAVSGVSILPLGDAAKLLKVGKHTKTIKKAIGCLTCFTGGTLVLTENGAKEIKDVVVGEKVWAYDEETGDVALKRVLVTHNIIKDSIFHIHISNGEKIEATPNHPFFVHGTWFQVKDLVQGDTLKTYAGDELLIIDSLILEKGEFPVYNFTVEDYHTYYVGQGEVLVHNCGGKKAATALKSQAKELSERAGKNTVTIRTPDQKRHYDLQGAEHKGVETPHIQYSNPNTNPNTGVTHFNKDRKTVDPMNQQDIRTVRRYLDRKN